jgi:hypothetical protein
LEKKAPKTASLLEEHGEEIYASYSEKDGRGMSAYAPAMMVRVLLYGYATGVYSSRKPFRTLPTARLASSTTRSLPS